MTDPQRVTLPPDLVARLAALGIDAATPVPLPDSHTESAEARAERLALQARNRASRWMARRPVMYADADLADLLADKEQAGHAQAAREWWAKEGAATLVAAGSVGTGKTHLAYALGNRAVAQGRWVEVWSVADLLVDLRPSGDPTAERRARDCDLLILDDLMALNVSPWAVEIITAIVDHRVNTGRRQVVTTNVPSDALTAAWGNRLMDRLAYRMVAVVMTGESRRKAAW